VSSSGKPISNGVPLYHQPFSACRGCPDAGKCVHHNLKNVYCVRYLTTVERLKQEVTA
jgi:hypothetical protein